MTRRQMLIEFKKGGITLRNALRISILKYKTLDKYWPFSTVRARRHYPEGWNCGLCHYTDNYTAFCTDCVLKSCTCDEDPYYRMIDAFDKDDRVGFNKYRLELLRKLEVELRKLETKKGKKRCI